jgi:hypothetical protein
MRRSLGSPAALLALGTATAACGGSGATDARPLPDVTVSFAPAAVFATPPELASYGFAFGPSDGQFGAVRVAPPAR